MRYKAGDTITSKRYNGFIVLSVSKGWYKAYHPSNTQYGIKSATTSLRWHWCED